MFTIIEQKKDTIESFFSYLKEHLSDNGKDGQLLFQPLSTKASTLSEDIKNKFALGLQIPIQTIGWRRLWIAVDRNQNIIGHIDLRSYPEGNTLHRAVLGMGVQKEHRKNGIGSKMIDFIIDWSFRETTLSWIDLQVLTHNLPAISLYKKLHFKQHCSIADMYRIDGVSYDYTYMSYHLDREKEPSRIKTVGHESVGKC